MRKMLRSVALAGLAAGLTTGAAVAASHDGRVMTVDLPDGSVARITYSGDVAPSVRYLPPSPFSFDPVSIRSFALLERISREMDRNFALMIRQATTAAPLLSSADGMTLVSQAAIPVGTLRYSYVMTGNGERYCSRSVQIMSTRPDGKPTMMSGSSEDCGGGNSPPALKSPMPLSQGRSPGNMI